MSVVRLPEYEAEFESGVINITQRELMIMHSPLM